MGKMMKKYIVRLLSLLVFWGLQFNHKAHAFNPDTLLEVQMGSKIKMIDSGSKCVSPPFFIPASVKNPHFNVDQRMRQTGMFEFSVKLYVCTDRSNVIRTFSTKPYLIDNEKPFVQNDVKNVFVDRKPGYISQSLRINLEGGLYIKLVFLNVSPLNHFLLTPLNPGRQVSNGGLSLSDFNEMLDGYIKFIPRQEIVGHESEGE